MTEFGHQGCCYSNWNIRILFLLVNWHVKISAQRQLRPGESMLTGITISQYVSINFYDDGWKDNQIWRNYGYPSNINAPYAECLQFHCLLIIWENWSTQTHSILYILHIFPFFLDLNRHTVSHPRRSFFLPTPTHLTKASQNTYCFTPSLFVLTFFHLLCLLAPWDFLINFFLENIPCLQPYSVYLAYRLGRNITFLSITDTVELKWLYGLQGNGQSLSQDVSHDIYAIC